MEINNYPNYLIFDSGAILSLKRNKFMAETYDKDGYVKVNLCKNGVPKTHKVHRLVGEHYLSNIDNKPQIDHINRDKSDNRVENIRWVTSSENALNKPDYNQQKMRCNNSSGYKNISWDKSSWKYQKCKRGVCATYKRFNTLQEALEYKKKYDIYLSGLEI